MELNSNETGSANISDQNGEQNSQTFKLADIIDQSRDNIADADPRPRDRPGRPRLELTDEQRKERRRAQNRAYKQQKKHRLGGEDDSHYEDPRPRRVEAEVIEPKPAGLAPVFRRVVDAPVIAMRTEFHLSKQELPDIEEEEREMLVGQADLTVGIFFPDAGNNKWVILGALLGTAAIVYGGIYMRAREAAAERARNTVDSERVNASPKPSPGMPFPTASV